MKALKANEPVWFGCDCSKMMHRDLSVWDARMFDFENLYGTALELPSKEDRLLFKRTAMNHAMLFTGVDEEKGKPKKWRVENSWGEKGRRQGLLRHERLVVRRAHVRDRRAQEQAACPPPHRAGPEAHRASGLGPHGLPGGVMSVKAVRLVKVGSPLEMQEVPIPKIGDRDVLVRVKAAGICHSDVHYRAGTSPVRPLPMTLGHEVAGVVEKTGSAVKDLHPVTVSACTTTSPAETARGAPRETSSSARQA